jgi:predicted membrane-bound spermidine synthase
MAAIIYQLIWQRALFTIFGTNVESVTVVVAAFMLGLGLGSMLGGWLSSRARGRLLLVFSLFELCIGTFGLFSLSLFHQVGTLISVESAAMTGLVSFLCVLFPTVLMGATLPLLVEYAVSSIRSVGRSVGILYFINTLGAAFASFVAAFYLFRELGEVGSVIFAASLNYLVAALMLASIASRRGRDALAVPGETG